MSNDKGLGRDRELVIEEITKELEGGRIIPGLLAIKKELFERGIIEPGLYIKFKNPEAGINEGDTYILNKSRGRSGTVGEFFKAVRVIADRGDAEEFVKVLFKTTAIEHLYYNVLRYLVATEKTPDNQSYYESRIRKAGLLEGMLKETLPVFSEHDLIAIREAYGFKSELELLGIKYTSQKRVDEIQTLSHEDLERELILRVFRSDSLPRFKDAFRIGEGNAAGSYLCMEFLDGDDLDAIIKDEERLKNQPYEVDVNVAFALGCKLLKAVEEMHKRRSLGNIEIGYCHGDIDPSNIFITNEGDVLLIDFSTIQRFDYNDLPGKPVGYKSAGKIYYMSSLALREGQNVHPQNDVHSAGVVLYEMITGKLPFYHFSERRENIKKVIEKGKTRAMSRIMGKKLVPPEADSIVLRCFEGGYESALDLQHALSSFLEKRGITGDYGGIIADPDTGLVGYKKRSAVRGSQYRVLQELQESKERGN